MKVQEFSDQFDVLVASYRRFKDFDNQEILDSLEFNEHEKSVFLTNAQEELVTALYNGRNPFGESFETTEELRRYLSNLVAEAYLPPTQNSTGVLGLGSKSKFFTLPENVWYITYESVAVDDGKCEDFSSLEVVPVRQDEYHRLKRNPFRGANDRRALRLDLSDGVIEIVSTHNVTSYYVRYLRRPRPIVLVDMPNGITIEGVSVVTDCELHDGLHQKILEMAVDKAIRSKVGSQLKKTKED